LSEAREEKGRVRQKKVSMRREGGRAEWEKKGWEAVRRKGEGVSEEARR